MYDDPLYNFNYENWDLCDFSNYCFEGIPKRKRHRRNVHSQEIILTLKQKTWTYLSVNKTSYSLRYIYKLQE